MAPDVLELARKIKYVDDAESWEQMIRYGKNIYAARIKTKDGKTRAARVEALPHPHMSKELMRRKFTANTIGIISKEQSQRLWSCLADFENVKISEFMNLVYPVIK